MAEILKPDYENAASNIAAANYTTAVDQMDNTSIAEHRESAGFFSTAGSTWMHETVIGNGIMYGFSPQDKRPGSYEFTDVKFNPFKYFVDNRDDLNDMDLHMKNGLFDGVITEAQFRDRTERLRKEMKSRNALANGSTAGMLFGGLLSFADVTAFVPYVNVAKPLATLGKIGKIIAKGANSRPGKYALAGGYYSVVQEVALHQAQDLRTLQESGYNATGGVILGGAIGGGISAYKNPNSLLSPKNPSNVFSPDGKFRMGLQGIGNSLGESIVLKPVIKGGRKTYEIVAESAAGQSLSAAAVKGSDMLRAGAVKGGSVANTIVKGVGKAGEAFVVNTIGRASPVISGLMSKSGVMRNITEHLYDLGGTLTKGHGEGEYKASVEDIANRIQSHFDTDILIKAREHFVNLQQKLAVMAGQSSSPTARAFKNLGSDLKELGADVVAGPSSTGNARARELEGSNGQLRHWEFEDIIASSMYDDITQKMMDNLTSRFGDEGAKAVVDAARKMGDDIHDLNKMIEDLMVEKGLIDESQRMGKDYVAPQLWDGKGIRTNKSGARLFFLEVFAQKPSDDFLADFNLTEELFNKLGREDVTVTKADGTTDLIKAGAEGETTKLEVLEDWTGDLFRREQDAVDIAYRNAVDDEKTTRRAAVLAARELRKSTTDFKNASVDEAAAILEARIADRDTAIVKRKALKLEKQKVENEIKLAEEELKARNALPLRTKRDEQILGKERKGEVQEAEDLFNTLEGDSNATKGDYDFAQRNLTDADNELANVGGDARAAARQRNSTKSVTNPKIQKLRERLRNINKDLHHTDRQIKRLEPKLKSLKAKVDAAIAAKQSAILNKKLLNKAKKEFGKEAGKAKRTAKRLKRKLNKLEKGTPLGNHVEELVDKMGRRDSSKSPLGMLDKELFKSNRSKTRMIKLTNEQRRRAQEIGILRSDFFGSLHEGVAEIAKRVALRQVFGHHGTDEDSIMKSLIKSVEDDYDAMIFKAKKAGKTSGYINRLEATKRRHMSYVEKGIQRQLGLLELPKDSEGVLGYLMSKSREFNYIRYGSGFLIPSITDLANVALTTGFGTVSRKNLLALKSTINGMGNHEVRRLALALETLIHNQRNLKLNNVDDMRRSSGIGDYGTIKHYTTSTADRVLNGVSKATTHASGMHWWNTRLKMLAMIEMQHNFVNIAHKFDDLLSSASAGNKAAELEIAKMASLGLGKSEMVSVIKMMKKHPPENNDGVLELGMARWLDEGAEGQRAYQDVLSALEHTANRAVMTPGKGDVPFFMSSDYGKTLMQFQTYGFVVMTRYMLPAFQRMGTYGDMEAFLSFAMGIGLGTGVVYAKDIINRGKVKERSAGEWAYDVIDRSGYIAWLTTPSAEIMKMFGKTPSRFYRQKDRMSLLLGPTGGLVTDVFDLKDAVVHGDSDEVFDAVNKLTPFTLHQRIMKIITD